MKICKDGRIWGQNNKEAGEHLGVLTGRQYKRKFTDEELANYRKNVGSRIGVRFANSNPIGYATRFKKGHITPNPKGQPRLDIRGKNHPRWKGGITKQRAYYNDVRYKNWRNAVFARDKYTCQQCGIKNHQKLGTSIKLEAHHLKSWKKFPKLRFVISNGETLCIKCHGLTRKGGSRKLNGIVVS